MFALSRRNDVRPARKRPPTGRLGLDALERRDVPSYSFVSLDVPGGSEIHANAINDAGQVVGYYASGGQYHGFLKTGDEYVQLDSTLPNTSATFAQGINNNGDIVGLYRRADTGFDQHAFLLSGGTYAAIEVPGTLETNAQGINDSGQIVGPLGHYPTFEEGRAFVKTGDTYEIFHAEPLGAVRFTDASAISNAGDVVGRYEDASGNQHGFLKSGFGYSTIDVPGGSDTYPHGINSTGTIIVGQYGPGSNIHGFVKTAAGFDTIDYPDAVWTTALGVNSAGQVVGWYTDTAGQVHSYLATPSAVRSTPTVTVAGGSFVYDGQQHPATGSVSGVNGEDLGPPSFTYSYTDDDGNVVTSTSPPVDPGYYTVTASFPGSDAYLPASATATIMIAYEARTLTDLTKAFHAGRTIPIKIQLTDANGNNISDPSITLTALRLENVATGQVWTPQDSGSANPDNVFRYDATLGGYIFNLSTKGLSAGTYVFSWMAGDDPTTHELGFSLV